MTGETFTPYRGKEITVHYDESNEEVRVKVIKTRFYGEKEILDCERVYQPFEKRSFWIHRIIAFYPHAEPSLQPAALFDFTTKVSNS